MVEEEKSEFGKGLVICLIKFAQHRYFPTGQHFSIINKFIEASPEDKEKMLSINPPDNLNYGFPFMQSLRNFAEMANKIYNSDYEKAFSREIELFVYGARDHLYEIEVPEGNDWDEIREKVRNLKDRSFEIGGNFDGVNNWKIGDLENLFDTMEEIALLIDRKIGLNPEIGIHP